MNMNYSTYALKGTDNLKNTVGCRSPCITTNYNTKQVGKFNKEQAFTDGSDKLLDATGSDTFSVYTFSVYTLKRLHYF